MSISIYYYSLYLLAILLVIDGWDICGDNVGDAMRKAKVLDVALQDQIYDKLSQLAPRPSVFDADFIAANQVFSFRFQTWQFFHFEAFTIANVMLSAIACK